MIVIGDVESYKWRHLCCFTDRQLTNAKQTGDIDNINGYDGLAPKDKELVEELKKGALVGKMDIKGRVGDIMNSSEAESLKANPPAKRGRAGDKEEGAKAAPRRGRAKKAVPEPEDDGVQSDATEDYEVVVEACDAKIPCPYGESCFRTDPTHFAQYSHSGDVATSTGKTEVRPVIKRKR
ncbi:hypothetical protein AGDE_04967 [Angomonas deanei]|nr:hypothetical protein AGDE_06422 [Angomonas deanei]EPY38962.1 hypothetical protein AGDE_04967 [Angomonas deanei]|eukprot:EPY37512.1 hypothetical protein AGDE_06422 [Angomonas deanei]